MAAPHAAPTQADLCSQHQVAVNAADAVYAAINAVEAWCLLGSVATFSFMDAMIVQAHTPARSRRDLGAISARSRRDLGAFCLD